MKIPTQPANQIDHIEAGKRIRALRERAGMSLRRLASKMGYTAPFVSDLERGRRNWTEENFNAALEILNSKPHPNTKH